MSDYHKRLSDLRDRAYRILEAARHHDDFSDAKVAELEHGLRLIEMGWETVENYPNPEELVSYNLDERLDEWEEAFDRREETLGIARDGGDQ